MSTLHASLRPAIEEQDQATTSPGPSAPRFPLTGFSRTPGLRLRSCHNLLLQAIAVAIRITDKLKHLPLVSQSVDKGEGHFVIPKNRGPFLETQIAGHDNRHALIQVATSLLIMRPSLAKISNWTKNGVRYFIVPDDYAPRQSCGQKRHSKRRPARRRYGR
jgi:hypothetical protein